MTEQMMMDCAELAALLADVQQVLVGFRAEPNRMRTADEAADWAGLPADRAERALAAAVGLGRLRRRGHNYRRRIAGEDLPGEGDRIRLLRQWRGLTQVQLAEAVEADQGQLSKIEAGLNRPGYALRARLAAVLGCEPADLI